MNEPASEPYYDSGNPYEPPPLHEEDEVQTYDMKAIRFRRNICLALLAYAFLTCFLTLSPRGDIRPILFVYLVLCAGPLAIAVTLLAESMRYILLYYPVLILTIVCPPLVLLLCLHATWVLKYGKDAIPEPGA